MNKYQPNLNSILSISEADAQRALGALGNAQGESKAEILKRLARYDKGLEMALSGNYLQEIDKSAVDKNIKLTIEGLIVDNKRLTISYSLDSKDDISLSLGDFDVKDNSGNYINAYKVYSSSRNSKLNNNMGLVTLVLDDDINTFPQNLIFECRSIEASPFTSENRTISGNWCVDFNFSTFKYNVMPRYFEINKKLNMEDIALRFDYVKIYPTVVDIKITFDEDNSHRFVKFKNLYLKDENGNMYSWYGLSSAVSENELVLHFESNYFMNSNELFLSFDGIYSVPKEDSYLVYDLTKNKIIEKGNYDIEIISKGINLNYKNKEYALSLGYKVKDKDVLKDDDAFLDFSNSALNELSNEISITTKQTFSPSRRKLFGEIFIENPKDSSILKFKIQGASTGIMEEKEIKLI